ncbi:hypothetical protein AHF37_11387 [Paragonimus kellicotti]|nr:hypothetical protein AHF37_11387 [Paragonimus kellicotti]
MTVSCYLDVDGCTRPVCLTKDIAMVVFPREAKLSVVSPRLTPSPTNALLRSIQSLWTSFYRVAQTSRVSAVYELLLRRPWITRIPVDRLDEPPCQGAFLIHQGLQRRLAITLVYETTAPDTLDPITSITTPPTLFQDVYEVVVGRVRDTPDWLESDSETRILSLSLFPVRYLPQAGDDRYSFQTRGVAYIN